MLYREFDYTESRQVLIRGTFCSFKESFDFVMCALAKGSSAKSICVTSDVIMYLWDTQIIHTARTFSVMQYPVVVIVEQ